MSIARLFGHAGWGAVAAGLLAALLLTPSGPASAQTVGITTTRHNLGSAANGIAGRNQVSTADTAEVCVFCHTPHGGSTTAPAPLWNKRLGAGGTPAGGGSVWAAACSEAASKAAAVETRGNERRMGFLVVRAATGWTRSCKRVVNCCR